MSVTLLSTEVPPFMAPGALMPLNDQEVATGASYPPLRTFANGDDITVPSKLNRNMATLALLGRYGGGTYGVVSGLVISIGTGLQVDVTAGQAVIDGIADLDTATSVVVPDNQAFVALWFLRDGTFTTATNLTPPAQPGVFIGSCVTAAGVVSSVDLAGVHRLKGGLGWREVADAGPPADAPSAELRFFTKTGWGEFYWNGSSYQQVLPPAVVVDGANGFVGVNNAAPDEAVDVRGHLQFAHLTAPTAPSVALAAAGAGNVDNGSHVYAVTFVTADGETELGATASVTVVDKATNGKVALTGIPLGPSGTTSRKVYRTKAGTTTPFLLLTTIADNTTTIYTDNTADSGLGAQASGDNDTAGTVKAADGSVALTVSQNGAVSIPIALREPVNVETLTAAKALTVNDAKHQFLKTDGTGVKIVYLPSKEELASIGDLGYGVRFRITNIGSVDALTIKNSTGTTTIATLSTRSFMEVLAIEDASLAPTWPTTPQTGVTALPAEAPV